jgi:hypothetical protein
MNTNERDKSVAVISHKNQATRERLEALRAANQETAVAIVSQQNAIIGVMSEGWAQTKRDNSRLIESALEAERVSGGASAQMRQVQERSDALTERVAQLELALAHAQQQLATAQNEEASRETLVEINLNLTRELDRAWESEQAAQAAQLALSVQLSTMVDASASAQPQVDTLVDANRVLECKLRETREEVRQVMEENAKIPRLMAQLADARRRE